jgi:hypothetical protein
MDDDGITMSEQNMRKRGSDITDASDQNQWSEAHPSTRSSPTIIIAPMVTAFG